MNIIKESRWDKFVKKDTNLRETVPLRKLSLCKEFFYFLHGWEFAHRFSEQIARFLQKISDWLKKRAIHSFAHFW